ncbi:Amidohydro-4 multi-domain protein [Pyrenophora tritici-repentis]|nr:Amidohydro-4 multi-domain protein [Pyrenophora tritici-repentis]
MTTFIIRDVRIFTGEEKIDEGYIHIEDGKINSVGPMKDIPKVTVKTYSKPGHTLLPGLIDCHIHADRADPVALPQALRFGVTTVCEMHNELENVQKLKKQTLEPDTASYKTAAQAATIENGWPIPVITAHDKSPETAAAIAKWPKLTDRNSVIEYLDWTAKEMQPDYIKLMHESGTSFGREFSYPSFELQSIIVEEAKKRGYFTVAHATCLKDTIDVLNAGVNGLTHTFCDQTPTQEVIDAYKKNNAWVNPTLATMGSLTTEGKELQHKFAHDPRVEGMLSEDSVGNMCKCMGFATEHGKVEYAYEGVRKLREAGVDILCGSDSAGPAVGTAFGLSMHHELHIFVHKIGMTPAEALRSATSLIAKRFKFEDRGQVAKGLNADLLLVEGNPLEDIDATLNIRGVWRDGNLCSMYAEKLEAGVEPLLG